MSVNPAEVVRRTGGPVHTWFGLSYSNYAVLHRALMQSMPVEWQDRMVACLEELHDAFDHVEQASGYEVHACRWAYVDDLDEETQRRLGITSEGWDGTTEIVYCDRSGSWIDRNTACVPVPIVEPVPHYNRGRTFVEPKETATS